MLTGAVAGMRSGYDPSEAILQFGPTPTLGNLRTFVNDALVAAPDVDMIYLAWEIVTASANADFDIVEAFHKYGKRIDAWTINAVTESSLKVVERLLSLKVDQITTDDPEGIAAALTR
jgi:glycerophosphoryl diester phosphodiesterase